MTIAELVDNTRSKPEIKALSMSPEVGGIGWTPKDVRKHLIKLAPSAVVEVSLAYDWDFSMRTAVDATVADQAAYTLKGNNQDAIQIAAIYYDESASPLTKRTKRWLDDRQKRETPSGVVYWYPSSRSNKWPVVTLLSTPTAVKELKYDYWRKDVDITEMPVTLDSTLEACLAKRLIVGYVAIYNEEIKNAIDAYTIGAGDVDPIVLDPVITASNRRKGQMYGYGGNV